MTDTKYPILSVRHLDAGYRDMAEPLLRDVSFDLEPATLTVMLGANGRGKSTLIRAITGEQPPLAGEVLISGADVSGISPRRLATQLSIVTTDRHVAGALTVSELVAMGRYPYTGFMGRLSGRDREICERAIDTVNLNVSPGRIIATLSDGERQKAMIARALAQEAPLIILDEPAAFLDAPSRIELMRLLQTLAHDHGRTVLISSHDIALSVRYADRLLLAMPDRRVVYGTPGALAADPAALPSLFAGRAVRYSPELSDFTL